MIELKWEGLQVTFAISPDALVTRENLDPRMALADPQAEATTQKEVSQLAEDLRKAQAEENLMLEDPLRYEEMQINNALNRTGVEIEDPEGVDG